MELKQIRELMAAMNRAGMKKIQIKKKDFEISLEAKEDRLSEGASEYHVGAPMQHPYVVKRDLGDLHFHHQLNDNAHVSKAAEKKDTKEGHFVVSPIVGTFYASPTPDDPSFVKVGDKVKEDTVICIIEAMKVMNEIKAGTKGVVAEVCLDSGHPVEFGTKIFRIVQE